MTSSPLLDLLGYQTDPAAEMEKPVDSRFGWATVTGVAPLRVRKDGETDPLPMTPDVIGPVGVAVGTRVWCQYFGRRVLVLGAGGAGDTGWVPIPSFGGFGGAINGRKVGSLVEVTAYVTGTFAATSNTPLVPPAGIPAGWWPTITGARGEGYGGLGRAMALAVALDGSMIVTNHGTATTSVQGRVLWTVP